MEFLAGGAGGGDVFRPSVFEPAAEASLRTLMVNAAHYASAVIAQSYPTRTVLSLQRNFDEIYSGVDLLVQLAFLRGSSGTFSENLYGLKRVVPAGGIETHVNSSTSRSAASASPAGNDGSTTSPESTPSDMAIEGQSAGYLPAKYIARSAVLNVVVFGYLRRKLASIASKWSVTAGYHLTLLETEMAERRKKVKTKSKTKGKTAPKVVVYNDYDEKFSRKLLGPSGEHVNEENGNSSLHPRKKSVGAESIISLASNDNHASDNEVGGAESKSKITKNDPESSGSEELSVPPSVNSSRRHSYDLVEYPTHDELYENSNENTRVEGSELLFDSSPVNGEVPRDSSIDGDNSGSSSRIVRKVSELNVRLVRNMMKLIREFKRKLSESLMLALLRRNPLVFCQFILSRFVYPMFETTVRFGNLTYQVLYILGLSDYYSLELLLAGTYLRRLNGDDMKRMNSSGPLSTFGKSSGANGANNSNGGIFSGSISKLMNVTKYALPAVVFSIRFLEWFYASEYFAKSQVKPIPPPPRLQPPSLDKDALKLPRDPDTCPICSKKRTNTTLLCKSGYLFCYPCIFNYVDDKGRCPVTLVQATTSDLRKIYT